MPREIIHVDKSDCGRLHCDNPRCGYILPNALEWGPQLIGLPCPQCDANLLTRKDYEATERAFAIFAWINKWFGWLGSKKLATGGVEFSMRHHDGKVTIDTLPRR